MDWTTARRVRRAVVRGQRVEEPELRPAAEFYVKRLERAYDKLLWLHALHIVVAVMFCAAFAVSIRMGSWAGEPWWAVVMGLNAVVLTVRAIFGPSFWRKRRRRLDVNRLGIESSP